MLYPSIDALMDKVNSKYTLVTISAERARNLKDKPELIDKSVDYKTVSFVGKALEEIEQGKIVVKDQE